MSTEIEGTAEAFAEAAHRRTEGDGRTSMTTEVVRRRTFTIPEAGTVLGVGRTAAYDAARRGEIPTIRVGRRLLVPRAALERLVGDAA